MKRAGPLTTLIASALLAVGCQSADNPLTEEPINQGYVIVNSSDLDQRTGLPINMEPGVMYVVEEDLEHPGPVPGYDLAADLSVQSMERYGQPGVLEKRTVANVGTVPHKGRVAFRYQVGPNGTSITQPLESADGVLEPGEGLRSFVWTREDYFRANPGDQVSMRLVGVYDEDSTNNQATAIYKPKPAREHIPD